MPESKITHDQAKRLVLRWHLLGVQWKPRESPVDDQALSEGVANDPDESSLA